jgi:hypothetical protein
MATEENQTPHADPEHPGSERHADEQRRGGPRYHGGGWEQADDPASEAEGSFDDEEKPERRE